MFACVTCVPVAPASGTAIVTAKPLVSIVAPPANDGAPARAELLTGPKTVASALNEFATLTGIGADSTLAGGSNPRFGRRLLATGAMFLGAGVGAFLVLRVGVAAVLLLTLVLLSLNAIAAGRLWSRAAA